VFVQDDGLESVDDADDDAEHAGKDLDFVLFDEVAAVLEHERRRQGEST